MSSQEARSPYEYHEPEEMLIRPGSGVSAEQISVGAIDQAMADIAQFRDSREVPNELVVQLYAGIVAGEGEPQDNRLIVIDFKGRYGYMLYAAKIDGIHPGGVTREVVAREAVTGGMHTHNRGYYQKLQTDNFGEIEISEPIPDPRFPGSRPTPHVAIRDRSGKLQRAAALKDVIIPTDAAGQTAAKTAAALEALDINNNIKRYPNLDDSFVNENSGVRYAGKNSRRVNEQLAPVREVIATEGLSASDRERLVNLGHTIMEIANRIPE